MEPQRFNIETEKLASGGFRNAFTAYTTNPRECRVIKQSQIKTWEKLESTYNMDLQTHTRNKQAQIHMTAKVIAEKLITKAKKF